jgi:hypothetical protein
MALGDPEVSDFRDLEHGIIARSNVFCTVRWGKFDAYLYRAGMTRYRNFSRSLRAVEQAATK